LNLNGEEREWSVKSEAKGIEVLISQGAIKEKIFHVINHEKEKIWTPYQTIIDKKLYADGVDIYYWERFKNLNHSYKVKTPRSGLFC